MENWDEVWDEQDGEYEDELCPNCECSVDSESDFCPACGYFLDVNLTDSSSAMERPMWFWWLGLLGVLAVIFSLIS